MLQNANIDIVAGKVKNDICLFSFVCSHVFWIFDIFGRKN
jgi:hypothetical protein